MKYKCLVLDHDDTVVSSTKEIHYPAFLEALRIMRPGAKTISSDDYFRYNFDPGFIEFMERDYDFTEEEFKAEEEIWKNYVSTRIPSVYPGMKEIIERQKAEGGYVCVVSHSFNFNILRDYKANSLPEPDMVFGWEVPREERKPSPVSLQKIAQKFGLQPSDILVVDDAKPGYDMARAFGADFAAAGWCHDVPEIRDFMKKNSDIWFGDVDALSKYLFS